MRGEGRDSRGNRETLYKNDESKKKSGRNGHSLLLVDVWVLRSLRLRMSAVRSSHSSSVGGAAVVGVSSKSIGNISCTVLPLGSRLEKTVA